MAGKFNLETIVSHVSENPLLEPNKFEVIISGPIPINKDILFNCHRCDVPSHTIGSFDHSLIGPKRKIPNEEIFDDLTLSLYNNKYLDEMRRIHEWMRLIGGQESWRMSYYNDIISDMQINVYDHKEKKTAIIRVFEAYPIGISELELSYAGEQPSDVSINWAFHSLEILRTS